MLDAFGLRRLEFWQRQPIKKFRALKGVSLDIGMGERVAILGRNGAGKSTLLKIIAGNLRPNTGSVHVNGQIGALLDLGIGFHEEFSGAMNIRSALTYNNLPRDELDAAVQDVVDFCELGEFLHQPVKTYSAGMRARLYFAVATALRPDILIVDEILGAGDAYFSSRSAERIGRLTGGGGTLLLVSHSMGQVLELCDRAIWVEAGQIQMEGAAPEVVRLYQDFTIRMEAERPAAGQAIAAPSSGENWIRRRLLEEVLGQADSASTSALVANDSRDRVNIGIASAVFVSGNDAVQGTRVDHGGEVRLRIRLRAESAGYTEVRVGLYFFTTDGRFVTEQVSPIVGRQWAVGEEYDAFACYSPLMLGPGEYLLTAGLFEPKAPMNPENAVSTLRDKARWTVRHLAPRALRLEVTHSDSSETSLFLHPATWISSYGSPISDAADGAAH